MKNKILIVINSCLILSYTIEISAMEHQDIHTLNRENHDTKNSLATKNPIHATIDLAQKSEIAAIEKKSASNDTQNAHEQQKDYKIASTINSSLKYVQDALSFLKFKMQDLINYFVKSDINIDQAIKDLKKLKNTTKKLAPNLQKTINDTIDALIELNQLKLNSNISQDIIQNAVEKVVTSLSQLQAYSEDATTNDTIKKMLTKIQNNFGETIHQIIEQIATIKKTETASHDVVKSPSSIDLSSLDFSGLLLMPETSKSLDLRDTVVKKAQIINPKSKLMQQIDEAIHSISQPQFDNTIKSIIRLC